MGLKQKVETTARCNFLIVGFILSNRHAQIEVMLKYSAEVSGAIVVCAFKPGIAPISKKRKGSVLRISHDLRIVCYSHFFFLNIQNWITEINIITPQTIK